MNDFNERDLFAAFAMCGMKANAESVRYEDEKIALWAFEMADAMLKEKEKRND